MHLKELNIINFKGIPSAELLLNDRINCFVGDNGAGKTNILEAIHYLSLCKSFVGTSDRQNITHNEEFFMVEGRYIDSIRGANGYTCSFSKRTGKTVKRNDKVYSKISEHIGAIPIVTITPRDNMLIDEPAEARRKYLDSFISQFSSDYLNSLIKYNAIISNRNQLLREGGVSASTTEMIELYNFQLQPYCERVHQLRAEVIAELAPLVSGYYKEISGGSEQVEINYHSQLNDEDIISLFEHSLERDINMGYTTSGLNRDDIKLSINSHPIKRFGSQGQQKSLLIALKLAQYDILSSKCGYPPLLLLDDLFDRLDGSRINRLLEVVGSGDFGQIFITDCDKERLQRVLCSLEGIHSIFSVEQGVVIEVND